MSTCVCVDCGQAFQRRASENWRRTCSDCWRRGARVQAAPLHVACGNRECEARALMREFAIRSPVLLAALDAAPEPPEREASRTFLRALVQAVAALEGGR